MKNYGPFIAALIAALVLVGFGFYAERSGYFDQPRDMDAIEGPAEQAEVTSAPTPTAAEGTEEAPAAPTDEPTPQSEDNCVSCHTDAETLKVLAVEEEAGEALSSGEG